MTAHKKMRVVQLGPMPPPHGGVATNMLAIHEALKRLGHNSVIVDVTNRNGTAGSGDVLKPHSSFGLIRALLNADCDIVHYHIGGNFDTKLALLTLFCGLLPGKRSVVTFHSGGYALDMADLAKPRTVRGVAFRSVDLLIGVNENMIRMFRAFGVNEKQVRLIPPFELQRPDPSVMLPPDLEAFANAFDPVLLSVGALEPEYRNDFLIDAMPRVLESFPNAGLLIVGSGSRETSLREEIDPEILKDRIKITGDMDHPLVLRLIERADILLRITDYDGDSIAVREAMSLGTPVVASDNALRPDGTVLLHAPFTSTGLVRKLKEAAKAQFLGHQNTTVNGGNAESVVDAYKELLAR